MEIVSGAISAELRSMIYQSTFGANFYQLLLNYGTLILFVTSAAVLILFCTVKSSKTEANTVSTVQDAAVSPSAPPIDEKPLSPSLSDVKIDWANPHSSFSKIIDGNTPLELNGK